MWSRVKFIAWTNPALEWKSLSIYKAWKLQKTQSWQKITWVWYKKYGQEYSNTESAILDEPIWEARWKRIESELLRYEELIVYGFLESCIFDFHDETGNIYNTIRLDRSYVLSSYYDEDLITTSIGAYWKVNYVTIYFLLNEWITRTFVNSYIENSKDDKTIIQNWVQLIMFTKQFTQVLYKINEYYKDFWVRRFELDSSNFPEYIDWLACLLYLEYTWLIYIDLWWPKTISTDRMNKINYVRIQNQEEFRKMVQWFSHLDMKDLERQEQLSQPKNQMNNNRLIVEVSDNYFISYTEQKINMTWIELKIITKLYNTNSNIISLSNATFKQTPWAFQKTLVRLRLKMKEWGLNLIKVRWKSDSYNLKRIEKI